MSTIRVVNIQHSDATEPNIVLNADGTATFVSGITISGGTNLTVSGTAEFASGTVSAPGITFIDDNNTGIYEPAADTVAITTNGTGRLFVDNSGNVGVGSVSVDDLFEVSKASDGSVGPVLSLRNSTDLGSANSGAEIRFNFRDTAGNRHCVIGAANAGTFARSGYIYFKTNSGTDAPAERLRIASNGNVGIGTTSPDFTLDVNGTVGITEGQAVSWHDGSGNLAARIYASATDELRFERGSGASRSMTIDSSGNVGIGTTSPGQALDVKGIIQTIGTNGWITNGDTAWVYFGDSNNRIGGERGGTLAFYTDYAPMEFGAGGGTGAASSAQLITFKTGTSERARIDSSGRLLVGTTSTTLPHLLNVNGSTRTSWFTCEETGKTVAASNTAVLTINGSNPSFVQVYIKVNFSANGALQAHFDYELITCDAQGSGGTTAIRQSLNESTGAFQVSTSDFAVTKSGQNIIITYTNQPSGTNQINFYVNGKFANLSIA